MREARGDAWLLADTSVGPAALCITTNGYVKPSTGECVMGRGIAREAKQRIPGVQRKLGSYIGVYGNRPFILQHGLPTSIVSFPVKHNWWEQADLDLIRRSAVELVAMANKFGWRTIVLPRPGCGNGRLSWDDVRPVLEGLLDDRFVVVTFPERSGR